MASSLEYADSSDDDLPPIDAAPLLLVRQYTGARDVREDSPYFAASDDAVLQGKSVPSQLYFSQNSIPFRTNCPGHRLGTPSFWSERTSC